ncbi:MAG: ATP synthase F0 subunit B [Desulfobia sp.]
MSAAKLLKRSHMITLDISFFITVVDTLILIVLLNIILYKPIRNILSERHEKITGLNNEIDKFYENARMRKEELDKKFSEARNRAKEAFETAKSEAQAEEAETLKKVREEADSRKAESLKELRSDVSTAEKTLKEQIESFAREMAGKVLGRAI